MQSYELRKGNGKFFRMVFMLFEWNSKLTTFLSLLFVDVVVTCCSPDPCHSWLKGKNDLFIVSYVWHGVNRTQIITLLKKVFPYARKFHNFMHSMARSMVDTLLNTWNVVYFMLCWMSKNKSKNFYLFVHSFMVEFPIFHSVVDLVQLWIRNTNWKWMECMFSNRKLIGWCIGYVCI